ncbi:MAG: 50S ribosomal protein L29 [candidate division WOR-3 bacterium]|jgi:large subunit ribosomal protein L29|uniref:Large ribosomal subunit protein uL29 n=1 Tax=candidate division WOR-3 bacterium TaxID=2052148 RepID=A0A7V3KN77_UNCW3
MKAKELRELSLDELNKKLKELKEELFTLRMDKALHRLNQPHRFKQVKREIARVLTVMNEKRGGNNGN